MKKLVLLFLGSVLLTSCGGDKKKEASTEVEEVKDKYVLIMDAIYEKDDSVEVVYQNDNFFKYDTAIKVKVIGAPTMQKLTFAVPEGIAVENFKISVSTNKDQEHLAIKNISISNNSKVINGDNGKFNEYFLTDESFSWDLKNSRFNLIHSNKYPPSLVGSDVLISLLTE